MLNLTRKDRRFCLRWTVAIASTLTVCSLLGPVGILLGPIAIAVAQGIALRRYWHQAILWSFATAIGGYVMLVAFTGLFFWPIMPLSAMVVTCGMLWGLAQSFVLRVETPQWWQWPLISGGALLVSSGWLVPMVVNAVTYGSLMPGWQWTGLVAVTGLIKGSLTGVALAWILPQC
ncbi:MAG: hypothetical protein AAGH78_15475 [Cyanobacteria bacterium P01_H01_bin.58]